MGLIEWFGLNPNQEQPEQPDFVPERYQNQNPALGENPYPNQYFENGQLYYGIPSSPPTNGEAHIMPVQPAPVTTPSYSAPTHSSPSSAPSGMDGILQERLNVIGDANGEYSTLQETLNYLMGTSGESYMMPFQTSPTVPSSTSPTVPSSTSPTVPSRTPLADAQEKWLFGGNLSKALVPNLFGRDSKKTDWYRSNVWN